MIGIVVCTYNPDERLLARMLAAIEGQTVPAQECVIVDNNSSPPIAQRPLVKAFLERCAYAQLVVEPRQGLGFARATGIARTSSAFVCFVDDDNEPAPDYLENAAQVLRDTPCLGVLGPGRVEVEFVDPVSQWFSEQFTAHFQARNCEGLEYACVGGTSLDCYPYGSSMIVRRDVLVQYMRGIDDGTLVAVGRNKRSLASGDDTQIVWEAVKMKLAAGVCGELRIRHLVPRKRTSLRYMRRLLYGTSSSYFPALVNSFPDCAASLPPAPSDAQITRDLIRICARHLARFRVKQLPLELAAYSGRLAGLLRASNSGRRPALERIVRVLGLE